MTDHSVRTEDLDAKSTSDAVNASACAQLLADTFPQQERKAEANNAATTHANLPDLIIGTASGIAAASLIQSLKSQERAFVAGAAQASESASESSDVSMTTGIRRKASEVSASFDSRGIDAKSYSSKEKPLSEFLQNRLDQYFEKNKNVLWENGYLQENGINSILQGLESGNLDSVDKAMKSMKDPAHSVIRMAQALNEVLNGTGIEVNSLSDQVTGKAGGLMFRLRNDSISLKVVSSSTKPEAGWSLHPAPPPDFGAAWVSDLMRHKIEYAAKH